MREREVPSSDPIPEQLTFWPMPEPTSTPQRQKYFASKQKVLGQFFTPPEVATFMCSLASSWTDRKLAIDPACGDGVFLASMRMCGFQEVIGADIDKEALSQIRLNSVKLCHCDALLGLGEFEGHASLVAGNPPFSAKYGRIKASKVLQSYELGRGRLTQAVEVLFCEKFIRLAKPRGAIAIILPQGLFASLPLKYVRDWLRTKVHIKAIVSLSRKIFKAKVSILFATKELPTKRDYPVFLAYAEELEDLPTIANAYHQGESYEHPLAFWKPISSLYERMDVEYHLPLYDEILRKIQTAKVPFERLANLLVSAKTGGTNYGAKRQFSSMGIRFISARTVTPTGIDFTREERFITPGSPMDKKWAHVQPGDVLFVRVGVGCAGRVAVVMDEHDTGIANDYLYILRFCDRIDPHYFAVYAYTDPFKMQVERLKRGVGTVTIPHKALKELLVPLPPLSIQREYAQAYRMVVEHHRAYLRAKSELRRSEAQNYKQKAEQLLREAAKSLEKFLDL